MSPSPISVVLMPSIGGILVLPSRGRSYVVVFFFKFTCLFFFKDLFIHLGERERTHAGGERGRERDSPLSAEPDPGLDPTTHETMT